MERQEIKLLLNYLENNPKHLNSLQHKFIASLAEHYHATRVLTKKQTECLSDMKAYLPSLNNEETLYEAQSDKYQAQYSSFNSLTTYNF